MKIAEIFESIHGEVNGHHQGRICTFIRFAGCNLQCDYCFGIRPGRRIPRLITSRVPNKKLHEVQKGDKLMTFDSSMNLVETTVVKTLKRQVSEWYRLKIDGTIYFVTPEHPFFTNEGLTTAENLRVGDQILHSNFKDKIGFNKLGQLNPMKRKEIAEKSAKNTDYVETGKKISATIKYKQSKGIYIPAWELLTKKQQKEMKQKISKANSGKKNGMWTGKNENYNFLKKEVKQKRIKQCSNSLCTGKSIFLEAHHIDGDIDNDEWENLQILCKSCHTSVHEKGYNFWTNKSHRLTEPSLNKMKKRLKKTKRNGKEVQEIKYVNRANFPLSLRPKPLKVYNVTCEPYNSYLIDYMWVHNCDTPDTQCATDLQKWSMEAVFKTIEKLQNKYICFTGGEPLLQLPYIEYLLCSLLPYGYKFSIETNGTKDITPLFRYVDSFVIDFKLNYQAKMHMPNFTNLRSTDVIKFVVATEADFHTACNIQKQCFPYTKTKAIIAFSAIEDKMSIHKLQKLLFLHKPKNAVLSVQLHKMLNMP